MLQPYLLQIGTQFPRKCYGWELECRDWREIPEWGLLLIAGRCPKGTWGRILWWEVTLEKSLAVKEAGQYCWVICRNEVITVAYLFLHTNASSWPIKTLERVFLWVPDMLTDSKGLQSGRTFDGLLCQAIYKDKPGSPFEYQLPETRKRL